MNRNTFIAILKMAKFKHKPDPSQNQSYRYEYKITKPKYTVRMVIQANKRRARVETTISNINPLKSQTVQINPLASTTIKSTIVEKRVETDFISAFNYFKKVIFQHENNS